MDMSACDRPVQVVEKTSRTARIENSVNIFFFDALFGAWSNVRRKGPGGPADRREGR
jgi:hypothetical protein